MSETRQERIKAEAARLNAMFASAPNPPERDEASVTDVVEALWAAWRRYPDQRVGQLIVNAAPEGGQAFYIENDRLAARLRSLAGQDGSGHD